MAYDYADISEESETNIRFGWAFQVLEIIRAINTYNYLCCINDYMALRPFYSHLIVLRDMQSAKFPKELPELDIKLADAEKSLINFESRRTGVMDEKILKFQSRKVHQKLRKCYDAIMMEMRHYGILDTIKIDLKAKARDRWYGDAGGV